MASEKVETLVAGNYLEMERDRSCSAKNTISRLLWHCGAVYDPWLSCSSNQVAQVLLTLLHSFSQLGMLSRILFHLFYGLMGSWKAYIISMLYVGLNIKF